MKKYNIEIHDSAVQEIVRLCNTEELKIRSASVTEENRLQIVFSTAENPDWHLIAEANLQPL